MSLTGCPLRRDGSYCLRPQPNSTFRPLDFVPRAPRIDDEDNARRPRYTYTGVLISYHSTPNKDQIAWTLLSEPDARSRISSKFFRAASRPARGDQLISTADQALPWPSVRTLSEPNPNAPTRRHQSRQRAHRPPSLHRHVRIEPARRRPVPTAVSYRPAHFWRLRPTGSFHAPIRQALCDV